MTAPNLSHGDMRPILSVERFSQRHAILKALRQRFTLDYATFRRTSGRIDNNGSSGKVVIVGYSRTIAGMENIKHALRWRELLKKRTPCIPPNPTVCLCAANAVPAHRESRYATTSLCVNIVLYRKHYRRGKVVQPAKSAANRHAPTRLRGRRPCVPIPRNNR